MKVVVDATPLTALAILQYLELLPQLFEEVFVPRLSDVLVPCSFMEVQPIIQWFWLRLYLTFDLTWSEGVGEPCWRQPPPQCPSGWVASP